MVRPRHRRACPSGSGARDDRPADPREPAAEEVGRVDLSWKMRDQRECHRGYRLSEAVKLRLKRYKMKRAKNAGDHLVQLTNTRNY